MFGLLNINKPSGCTSRDAVNRIQRLVRPAKIGHCGTLDPLAQGVLVIAIGSATRLVENVQQMPKHYRGRFLLGYTSPTEDTDGLVEEVANICHPSRDEVESALPRFCGTILQRPPAYSALKVQGRRAYDLARQGVAVELQPREITVYGLEVVAYEDPRLEIDIICGSGTYVRSLGRDLAESLGTSAVMEGLTRTAIGPFHQSCSVTLEQIEAEGVTPFLVSPRMALHPRREIELDSTERQELVYGRPLANRWAADDEEVVAITRDGDLAAVLTKRTDGLLWPVKNFAR